MPSLAVPSVTQIRHVLRHRRRPVAAALAGAAVLIALISLQPAPPVTAPPLDPTQPIPGEVAITVELSSQAAAAVITPGDRVDIIERPEAGPPRIIARDARVLAASSAGFLASSSAALLIAVDEPTALRLSGASGDLTPLIRPPTHADTSRQ